MTDDDNGPITTHNLDQKFPDFLAPDDEVFLAMKEIVREYLELSEKYGSESKQVKALFDEVFGTLEDNAPSPEDLKKWFGDNDE